jgi:hypothetical protein
MRSCFLALAVTLAAATPATAQPAPAPKAAPAQKPSEKPAEKAAEPDQAGHKVEGFRSARFGMTEQQVRNAIRKDFNLAAEKVAVEENPVEKTTVLTVLVPDLLPDAGTARLSYILGFKSKKLIQVNLLWGTPLGTDVAPEKMRSTANALGQYFVGLGFPPESVIANARLKDGTTVVFQGSDAQKRTAVLRFAEGTAAEGQKPPVVMTLFYIQSTENPDVFRIGRGQF